MTLAKLCLLTQTVNLPSWDPARELWEEELLSIHSIVVANTRKKNPCCWKSLNSHTSFLSLAMSLWCTVCITAVYCNMYCKKSSASGFRVSIPQPNNYNYQAKVFWNYNQNWQYVWLIHSFDTFQLGMYLTVTSQPELLLNSFQTRPGQSDDTYHHKKLPF